MSRLKLVAAVAASMAFLAALVVVAGSGGASRAEASKPDDPYQVWLVDQTDSRGTYGGYLHVYSGRELEDDPGGVTPETYDLGGQPAEVCMRDTNALPIRPHMLFFESGERQSADANRFAVVSWVASGHITIHDAETREAIACLRTSPGPGGARQAHAAWPTADGRYILVSNQNGKKIERIRSDWEQRSFTWDGDAELKLYEGTTPNGAPRQGSGRPDNAPICTRSTRDERFAFVSLRGGGAFVIDHRATPMRIVAEYDREHIDDNGCGQIETKDTMYVNAGAGAPGDAYAHKVYGIDLAAIDAAGNAPNEPTPRVVVDRPGESDAHGGVLTKNEKFLLSADRIRNDVTVIDTRDDTVLGTYSLAGEQSSDPAPDLLDLAPDAKLAFASLRGPAPLSGGHDAIGATPGLGVVDLDRGGRDGGLSAVHPAPRPDERPADPHAVRVRVLR